jgi:hypothetical protein
MHLIYKFAWATIVALTGNTADAGLPRVRFPGVSAQREFSHGTLLLMTVLPTLKQQIRTSPWSKRAWTYQEALLSPRCLYFTPEQVYFCCNMTQFCESIDETGSSFWKMNHEEVIERLKYDHYTELGEGIYRDPSCTPFETKLQSRCQTYSDIFHEYTSRHLTYDSDAFNAISAILLSLESAFFSKGFFWGIPIEGFPHALAHWTSTGELSRRNSFPSWCWLGWKGNFHHVPVALWSDESFNVSPPPLTAFRWNADHGTLEIIYQSDHTERIVEISEYPGQVERWSSSCGIDPIVDFTSHLETIMTEHFDLAQLGQPILSSMLFLQGLVYRPKVDCTSRVIVPEGQSQVMAKLCREAQINGEGCFITCDNEELANSIGVDPEGFLFPRRRHLLLFRRSAICVNHFLVLEELEGDFNDRKQKTPIRAQRVGAVTIFSYSPSAFQNPYLEALTQGAFTWSSNWGRHFLVSKNYASQISVSRVFCSGSLRYTFVALE